MIEDDGDDSQSRTMRRNVGKSGLPPGEMICFLSYFSVMQFSSGSYDSTIHMIIRNIHTSLFLRCMRKGSITCTILHSIYTCTGQY